MSLGGNMEFKLWLENLQNLVAAIKQQHPTIDLFAWENNDKISLDTIKIPKELQNQGIGTDIVTKIQKYAQKVGKPVVLSPSADKGKKEALNRFYNNLGFTKNKGRKIDFTLSSPTAPTSYWKPEQIKITQEHMGFHHGQHDFVIYAQKDGETIGKLKFSEFEDIPQINWIEVDDKYKRKGIGSRLVKHLADQYGYDKIKWGMTTDAGTKLKKSLDDGN